MALSPAFKAAAQIPERDVIEILMPLPGQAIQGSFPIQATISVAGFREAALSFRYTSDPTDSWFKLAHIPEEVSEAELVVWDTTALTDGDYDLQLVVFRDGEEPLITTIAGLRVRNYSIIETDTPAPTNTLRPDAQETLEPTGTPAPTPPQPTPTSLPPNPAEVTGENITSSLLQGVASALIAFLAVGLLLLIRALSR